MCVSRPLRPLACLGVIGCGVALTSCQSSSSEPAASSAPSPTVTETVTETPSSSPSETSAENSRTPDAGHAHGPQVTRQGLDYDTATRACDAKATEQGTSIDWDGGLLLSKVGGDKFILKARVANGQSVAHCIVIGTAQAPSVVEFGIDG
ncbi:hypothetical protein H8R18_08895 [Nanchangia anserum]|uniref:Uncharacterized protein n=1 Tax=Nanchangia anserum TaxID=2692125 RepID=A0A8I0G833_9ACTO|nr:hypothetical protein [Nanchangia anserum]MBD3689625.1 hypothetical protein [Nanchangia anserum]QOX81807.1 hypothetical protein H8R18_08895 [Nanchangia anserum]